MEDSFGVVVSASGSMMSVVESKLNLELAALERKFITFKAETGYMRCNSGCHP